MPLWRSPACQGVEDGRGGGGAGGAAGGGGGDEAEFESLALTDQACRPDRPKDSQASEIRLNKSLLPIAVDKTSL